MKSFTCYFIGNLRVTLQGDLANDRQSNLPDFLLLNLSIIQLISLHPNHQGNPFVSQLSNPLEVLPSNQHLSRLVNPLISQLLNQVSSLQISQRFSRVSNRPKYLLFSLPYSHFRILPLSRVDCHHVNLPGALLLSHRNSQLINQLAAHLISHLRDRREYQVSSQRRHLLINLRSSHPDAQLSNRA